MCTGMIVGGSGVLDVRELILLAFMTQNIAILKFQTVVLQFYQALK